MGAVPTVMNADLAHLIRAEGYSRPAGFGVAFGGVLNIILDPIFIFALRLNIAGAAIAQGMTQGTLPLIGYNYTSGSLKRMKAAIKTAFAYSFLVACAGTVLLWTLAAPISRCFIADAETVRYGQHFLKIICLACPTTAINFMVITVFQTIGKGYSRFACRCCARAVWMWCLCSF